MDPNKQTRSCLVMSERLPAIISLGAGWRRAVFGNQASNQPKAGRRGRAEGKNAVEGRPRLYM